MVGKNDGGVMEATSAIEDFFKKTLKKASSHAVKMTATDSGWEGRVEVVEESESMRAIGKRVMEKHLYDVVLDKSLSVASYDRHEKA